MNEIEAQLVGKKWIKFEQIPPLIKQMYDIQLALTGLNLKEGLQKHPRAYEIACEYWLNNTIDKAI